jgi:hypothetical protein
MPSETAGILRGRMKRVRDLTPSNLETELEAARLDLLALFRALDRLDLTAAEIPQELLHKLFELDADFAEALHVLDFPARGLDVRAMIADTQASLRRVPSVRQRFLAGLAPRANAPLERWITSIRPRLTREDARHSIPTRDPRLR